MSETTSSRLPSPRTVGRANVRARYDAAQTTDENRRHWGMADYLSPDAAANPVARRTLRSRSRYEVANNSYAKGVVLSIANDCVGTGPRLNMQTGNTKLDEKIETEFAEWAEEIGLPEQLRSIRMGRCESGETFGIMVTNPGLAADVKLDLKVVESDQVSSPLVGIIPEEYPGQYIDGIHFDRAGNATVYDVLKQHPGEQGPFIRMSDSFDPYPAKFVLHYFRPDRPGQRRGLPELTPALPLFALSRRYTLAVISAAETAAMHTSVIQTDASPDGAASVTAYDAIELERNMAVALPQGWKLGQMKAEQPTTQYGDFIWTILREICRCLNVPMTMFALDSSKSNLSAAYLDHQIYAKNVAVDRQSLERLLNRLLDAWLTEAANIEGYLPVLPNRLPRQWFWPSLGNHADPMKVANAAAVNFANGAATHAREYAKHGLDWRKEMTIEAECMGVTLPELQALYRQRIFGIPGNPATAPTPDEPAPKVTPEPESDEDPGDTAPVDESQEDDAADEGE